MPAALPPFARSLANYSRILMIALASFVLRSLGRRARPRILISSELLHHSPFFYILGTPCSRAGGRADGRVNLGLGSGTRTSCCLHSHGTDGSRPADREPRSSIPHLPFRPVVYLAGKYLAPRFPNSGVSVATRDTMPRLHPATSLAALLSSINGKARQGIRCLGPGAVTNSRTVNPQN